MRLAALLCVLPAMAWQHLKEIKDPQTYAALVYEPQGSGPWPLLLYLHGAGESGSNVADLISEGATGTPPVAHRDARGKCKQPPAGRPAEGATSFQPSKG